MKTLCHQCKTEMIAGCKVTVEGGMYGLKISRKGGGLFRRASAKPKAAVCPKCGYTALYIDNPSEFTR
ncbi:nucleic acid-binding protein [Planomicrobium sp. CPCC 101110]|uniref:nucleic acid-binding protein n=1 Tax=Planomicrobium sp. CPCC 101110 TaxID=2599619 RepID=UPI001C9870DA|nr:nucleic acid-binding protein [Planomicrobium sp. CPCC 101110]